MKILRGAGTETGESEDLVYVRLITGIGGGIVNKGHLVNGADGFAGELGHVTVMPGGSFCTGCGGRGCLETIASNRALVEQLTGVVDAGRSGEDPPQVEEAVTDITSLPDVLAGRSGTHVNKRLEALLSSNHPAVERALWDAGWQVGTVIATVCCVLNPATIVFHGLASDHGCAVASGTRRNGRFLRAVEHAIASNTMHQLRDHRPRLRAWNRDYRTVAERLSPELLGALALVLDELGDAYLLGPIAKWIRSSESRKEELTFSRA